MSEGLGLGLLVEILGVVVLVIGIVLGNARVVGAGALTLYIATKV